MSRRTTGRITYSLKDRKYQHNGVDRNDLDIDAMIRLIRSPALQERINKRCIFGYYGHQLRERYGLNVPETAIDPDTGKEIHLTPALVTIHLSVDDDGNVTHEQEFINNLAGNQAYRQFKAKIGGFSSAFYSPYIGGKRVPQDYFGMDYVLRPNYHMNRASDAIFDSLDGVSDPYRKVYLDHAIAEMYDSLQQVDLAYNIAELNADKAKAAEQELEKERALKQRRIQREKLKQKQDEMHEKELQAAILLDSIPFDQVLSQADSFIHSQIIESEEVKKPKEKSLAEKNAEALTRFL